VVPFYEAFLWCTRKASKRQRVIKIQGGRSPYFNGREKGISSTTIYYEIFIRRKRDRSLMVIIIITLPERRQEKKKIIPVSQDPYLKAP